MNQSIINIPKVVKFLGVEWTVEQVEDLCHDNNNLAEIKYRTHQIILQKPVAGYKTSVPNSEISFLHELVHLLLKEMDYDICEDEKFVDMLARFLYALQKENKIFK